MSTLRQSEIARTLAQVYDHGFRYGARLTAFGHGLQGGQNTLDSAEITCLRLKDRDDATREALRLMIDTLVAAFGPFDLATESADVVKKDET